MIQAKELRIGNLVISPSLNEITVNARWILEQHQCDLSNCEYLQPIPITEEWLLKLGFEMVYISEFRTKLTHKKEHFIGYDLSHVSDKSMEGFTWYGRYITDIKYIHQLQNLYFALTQKELEIK
jgi:hypothetical protein